MFAVVAGLGRLALAGEGMWLPEQLPALAAEFQAAGFELPAASLADPLQPPLAAMVGLGFCSASFVSPEGLILTNLHCIDGFVSYASRDGENLLRDGFVAKDRASERGAGPAARVFLLESVTDVTAAINGRVFAAGVSDGERLTVAERAMAEVVAKCEKQKARRCRVAAFDAGASYRLLQSLEIRDVRVVYSPPEGVGFFGGDLDNFEWPRHDADFGALRAYVGRNGKPAAPSDRNVPFRPAHWLAVNADGVGEGDPVMVVGYPANTERWLLPEELRFEVEVANPADLETLAATEALLEAAAAASPVAAERLQSLRNNLANGRKYRQGLQDNVASSTVLADKEALAQKVGASADPETLKLIAALRASVTEGQRRFVTDHAVSTLLNSTLLDVAQKGYRWALQRAGKPRDLDREPGLQDRDRDRLVDRWTALDEELWLPAEAAYLRLTLETYAALPDADRIPALDAWLAAHGGPVAASEVLTTSPPLAEADARAALLSRSAADFEASKDPTVSLAVVLEGAHESPRRAAERTRKGLEMRLRPAWVAAARTALGGRVYPDANSTLRITFGKVHGYSPRDGLWATPRTGLSGIAEKARRSDYVPPPDPLLAAIRTASTSPFFDADQGDVPVNFLSDLDTTGGNSGSPTLDANGRLVGLVFDGNYESMAADWQFDDATTRSIHIDIRYIGWLLALDPATTALRTELGLQ